MEERLERPRISIVIPAYNEQARIGNALTEVLRCVHQRDWHAEILVVHHPHQAVVVGQVFDFDFANQDVAGEVDRVVAVHRQFQAGVIHADAGGQGVAQIALVDGPAMVIGPEQRALGSVR